MREGSPVPRVSVSQDMWTRETRAVSREGLQLVPPLCIVFVVACVVVIVWQTDRRSSLSTAVYGIRKFLMLAYTDTESPRPACTDHEHSRMYAPVVYSTSEHDNAWPGSSGLNHALRFCFQPNTQSPSALKTVSRSTRPAIHRARGPGRAFFSGGWCLRRRPYSKSILEVNRGLQDTIFYFF
jgi:hypothetical protein